MKTYILNAPGESRPLLLLPLYEKSTIPAEIAEYIPADASFDLEAGKEYHVLTPGTAAYNGIVFIGLGTQEKMTKTLLRETIGKTVRTLKKEEICIYLDTASTDNISLEEAAEEIAFGAFYSAYDFTKINVAEEAASAVSFASSKALDTILEDAFLTASCVNHARTLGNTPGNYMTPEILADEAKKLAEEFNLKYEILTNTELEAMGAGAILGVNKGSSHGARLITVWYNGNGDAPYTALVGKGLTFDSGGYNLKPSASMTGMKFDMCGAANVLGAFELTVRRKAKTNLMLVIGSTENKIGPDAYTCDDVLVSLSGKTVEITNTDAEGRLVLCDAITYAQKQGATAIIDAATLTGACVVALGDSYTGVFTNSEDFLANLKNAASKSSEKVWQLPVDEHFHKQVCESAVADMTNAIPGAGAGSSLAAAFLEEFVEDNISWIHLDIAGTSDCSSPQPYAAKGATGVMVRTLGELFR